MRDIFDDIILYAIGLAITAVFVAGSIWTVVQITRSLA